MFHKSKAQMLQNYKNTDKAIEIGAMYTLNKWTVSSSELV